MSKQITFILEQFKCKFCFCSKNVQRLLNEIKIWHIEITFGMFLHTKWKIINFFVVHLDTLIRPQIDSNCRKMINNTWIPHVRFLNKIDVYKMNTLRCVESSANLFILPAIQWWWLRVRRDEKNSIYNVYFGCLQLITAFKVFYYIIFIFKQIHHMRAWDDLWRFFTKLKTFKHK